ncbi:MAG: purine-binding chemotaxis protein CheW [Clostridiales bacterium]|jgi:purine-binding chemotaxis protein CheW|nr:purine-binding chemotaxis protein CheW [Clostridiales bacterium]
MAELSTKQYISIRLGNDLYAIEIKYIENIIVMQNITRVPKAQSYFLGVINLRGEIIPVMSLKARLGLEKDVFTPTSRIIILKPERTAAPVGITVDEVNEVIDLSDEDIETLTYDDKEVKAAYSLGIGKYGSDLINILNVPELIGKDE